MHRTTSVRGREELDAEQGEQHAAAPEEQHGDPEDGQQDGWRVVEGHDRARRHRDAGTSPLIAQGGPGDPKEVVPLGGRWGKPEEVADVAPFLAALVSAYITGEAIVVDAGFLLQ